MAIKRPSGFAVSKLSNLRQPAETAAAPPIRMQRIFLGFVVFCLVAPLLQTVYPIFGSRIVAPVEERRAATSFPPLRLLAGTDGSFAAQLNQRFDDRAGFRDLLIRTKNQIDYSLFHTAKRVYIGADGWYFYRDRYDIDSLDAAGMSELESSYLTLAHRLSEKGIRLIVVGYPTKAAIYPEMAPPEMPLRRPGGSYDQFRQFLSNRSELTFIDAEEIIKTLKPTSSEQLYAKADTHATAFAQRAVVKEIVAQIALAEDRPDIHWNETLTLTHQHIRKEGIERNLLALLFPPQEDLPVFSGEHAIGGQEPDGRWTVPDPLLADRADPGVGRPFDFEFRALPQLCPQRLPGMVLFGNSFSDVYWSLGLQRYFCFIRRARNPMSRFTAFYDTIPPDTKYFIFQYYEPSVVADKPPLR